MNPTPTPTSTPERKGLRVGLLVLAALGVLLLAGPALREYTSALNLPKAGSFDIGVLQVPMLGAFQFFAAVSIAYAAWRLLFPKLYAYVRDCMEEKLFATLTADLLAQLPGEPNASPEAVALATEKRHIAQFQFRIRCVRLLLCLLPFFLFLLASLAVVNNALTVVPH